MGLVEQVSFDGRRRVIRSLVGTFVQQSQSKADLDLNPRQGGRKIQPWVGEKSIENDAAHIDIESKGKIKGEKGGKPPKNPPRAQVERAPHVTTSEDEHRKLGEEFTEPIRDEAYQVLSEWKEDTPKVKWKKSDYRSIRRWVVDSIKEKKTKNGKSRANKNLSPEQKQDYEGLF